MLKQKGFTLIELLVVISIIGLLSSVVLSSLDSARNNAKVALAVSTQREMQKAVELYVAAMDFYPPDLGRGTDPGLAQPLPYNADSGIDCDTNPSDCPPCPWCPNDWVSKVQTNWRGPYLPSWPQNTPWGGKYDYNYWPSGANRYGCNVLPGAYIGVQGNYSDTNKIPATEEQQMIDKNLDGDGCLNGESQMLLFPL